MNNLSERIYNFISKQIRFENLDEATKAKVKAAHPQEFAEKKPQASPRPAVPREFQKPAPMKKRPSTASKKKLEPKDRTSRTIEEVGRQLSPKGHYRSPEDIAADVAEAQRASRGVRRFITSRADQVKGKKDATD